MSFLSESKVRDLGLLEVGRNALISDKASFYGAKNIRIGNNVRIDDFSIISAGEEGISIGSYVHIAALCTIIGREKITLSDFSGLSSRVSIYSSTDDYSGLALTNPTVPDRYTRVQHAPVYIGRHSIIGCGSVVLPGSIIEEGVAVGALTLISRKCESFGVYLGSPARKIGDRKRDLLELEKQFLDDLAHQNHESESAP